MKNFIYMAAIACLALFTSCEKQGVDHTGDQTGKLYGRWVLETKHVVTESTTEGETSTDTKDTDYSNDHFFMGIGEFPFPHAMVKEGSLLTFDIDHVDGTRITYNSELKKISFLETLYLLRGTHSLRLHGTYDVVELTDSKLTLRQEVVVTLGTLIDTKQTTTYTFRKLGAREE